MSGPIGEGVTVRPHVAVAMDVVIPVFNEAECLPVLFERLEAVRTSLAPDVELRVLFVDDGSTDRSSDLLDALAAAHAHVRVIGLSRNFGHQIAVTAGLDHAAADWVVVLDADLQDPPEEIVPMYRRAQQGFDVVYGQRRTRAGEGGFKRASAALFYRLLGRMTDVPIPPDTGDFRIVSRRVVAALGEMRERHRFLRGMVPWLGFPTAAHVYDRDARYAGQTKYPLRKMMVLATNAIMSFSTRPLAFATRFGIIAAMIGVAGAVYMIYLKLFTSIPVPGITSILVSLAIFSGIQIALIGVLGEYLARVFEEVKSRPLYVVGRMSGPAARQRDASEE